MRAIPALIVMAVLIAAAVFVADRPGSVAITWQGWRIDTSVAVVVLGTVLFAVIVAALYNILRRLFGAPGAYLAARRERRRRQGYRALTQGMVAVAAGDAAEALRLARQADGLLAEPPLTLLLSAQAAQLNGDEQAAQRYFTAMLDRPETEFLGLRGLVMQALRGGDEATALRLTERARALRPRTPWVLSNLVELCARAGRWSEAEAALEEAGRRKALPAPESRHRRAVLLAETAREAEAQGRGEEALRLAAKAQGLDPGFAPIAVDYGEKLRLRSQTRQARKVLEQAWRVQPHPTLAAAYARLFADDMPVTRLKRFERLADIHPAHVESRLALARAALEARLWGEARRHLLEAGVHAEDETTPLPPPRLCRLMAEIEAAEHSDHTAARLWLGRAAATTAPDPAYVCTHCGAESRDWHILCPRCRSFDTLVWQEDRSRTVPHLAVPAVLADMPPAAPPPLLPATLEPAADSTIVPPPR